MIQALLIVLSVYLIANVAKKPENGMIVTFSILSFGKIFDFYWGGTFRYVLIFIIFLLEIYNANVKNKITIWWIVFASAVVIKETFAMAIGINTPATLMTSFNVYLIFFSICLFSYNEMVEKRIVFYNQLKIFVVLSIIVQLYRMFIDYTFGGIISLDADKLFHSAYQMGGGMFRPSNLESSIIYSVELSFFFVSILFFQKDDKRKTWWLLITFISIIITQSRSGLVFIFIGLTAYCLIKKSFKFLVLIGSSFGVALSIFGNFSRRFSQMLDGNSQTYDNRYTSMTTVIKQIVDSDLINIFLGHGYGSANYINPDKTITFYVENFPLSLIINSGSFTFILFVVCVYICLKKGFENKNVNVFILLGLLVVNLLACSLLMYSIQMLFWYLIFSLYNNKSEKAIEISEKSFN